MEQEYSLGGDQRNKLSINNSQFESMKSLVERLEIKSLILKVTNEKTSNVNILAGSNSKMRSSMMIPTNGVNMDSSSMSISISRTPGNSKMSLSTI